MSDVIQYRKMADRARSEAAAATLPSVRQLQLRSADQIEKIIAGLDDVAQAKSRNEEAKRTAGADDEARSGIR